MLFSKASMYDVIETQKNKIKQKIVSLEADYILKASEDDIVAWLVGEFTLTVPVVDEAAIHVEHEEKRIDVSRDPMRMIPDRSRPFFIAGTQLKFILPFIGDSGFFDIRPQGFSSTFGTTSIEIAENEIHFTYANTNLDGERLKRAFDQELEQIKRNLSSLETEANRHNEELERLIRGPIQQRKSKLLQDAKMAAAIGYPIKRRDGAPTTYSVPIKRHTPKIERPTVQPGKFQAEPELAITEYEFILGIIRNMVQVMERSPKAFESLDEEALRTHFLVQLNAQYEGKATGETFNFQGKTDILIRTDERNVFIAECKFWGGEKQFFETIDQLLSYLSWRDTKTAVVIFSRKANFSEVLRKIEESTPKHPNYKRTIGKLDSPSTRYIFHQPNDHNREVILTVLAFDVPSTERHSGQPAV